MTSQADQATTERLAEDALKRIGTLTREQHPERFDDVAAEVRELASVALAELVSVRQTNEELHEALREKDRAFEIAAARMMQLLCEFFYEGSEDNWDPADAHEEIRESHPEMAAVLQRNWEATGNSSRAALASGDGREPADTKAER